MDVSLILQYPAIAIIVTVALILIAGFTLRTYRIFSIILIIIASLIIYVLLYKQSPIPPIEDKHYQDVQK